MLIIAIGQSLLVFKKISFEQSLKFFPAALLAIWLLSANYLALMGGIFATGLIIVGFIAGLGYLLATGGFLIGSQRHVLYYLGSGLMLFGYPLWAVWLGQFFSKGG